MKTEKILIRRGTEADLDGIVRILNYYILNTHHTFDTLPFSIDERQDWIAQFSLDEKYLLLVAEVEGNVVAYAHSTPFRPKPAYDTTVETTVYADPGHTRKGLGKRLLKQMLENLASTDAHRAIAVIALPNEVSITLHLGLGFKKIGTFSEAGYKFDRFWDVSWYQKSL